MKKIRINELARELEVKPGVILDLLPELGVQEKKTHSSSVDEDVAIALRDRLIASGELHNGSSHSFAGGDRQSEEAHEGVFAGHTGVHDSQDAHGDLSAKPALKTPLAEFKSEESAPEKAVTPPVEAHRPIRPPFQSPVRPVIRDAAPAARPEAAPISGPPSMPLPPSGPAISTSSVPIQTAPPVSQQATQSAPRQTVPVPAQAVPGSPVAVATPASLATPVTMAPSAAPGPSITMPGEAAPAVPGEPERPAPRFQPLRPPMGLSGPRQPLPPSSSTPKTPGMQNLGQGGPGAGPVTRSVPVLPRPLVQAIPRSGSAPSGSPLAGPRQPLPAEPLRPSGVIGSERVGRPAPMPERPVLQQPSVPVMASPSQPLPRPAQPPTHVVAPGPSAGSPSQTPGSQTPVLSTPGSQIHGSQTHGPQTFNPAATGSQGMSPGASASGMSGSGIPGSPIPPRQPSPRPAPGLTPGAPIAPRPLNARPGLAGQPSARPTVPPRPDLVQRLKQQQIPGPRPGMVSAPTPRPAAPGRPAPSPSQPLYHGPVRPGQPLMRGPGGPAIPGAPNFPGGAGLRRPGMRPMHPTSPLRAESATPTPTEQQRRHQAKPGARPGPRKREEVEGRLRERVSKRSAILEPPPIDREITVAEGVTVKELSEKLGVKANLVIKKLVETKKFFATINQTLDVKLAEELAREFGASTNQVSYEQESTQEVQEAEETGDLVKRAPVVTIMGHVDHGKTSLLDAIRQTNVAGREAGGITQHIGAYRIEKNNRKIVFIDTPGHQAFTRMRARGAKITDIVILVVSSDDGVMPQTLEAIDHARAAKVPIIVAINKIDKPGALPDRVMQQLSDRGLVPESWGGDTVMVPVSAKTGQNLDLLLEMILLVADLQDLKANPARPATGTVLEAKLDKGRGPVATVIVRNGTLRAGDFFICGALFSKVRAMFDDRGNAAKEAEPSMPVEVIGLDALPEVGDDFQVVSDTSKAKQIVVYREAKAREVAMAKGARVATLDSLARQFKEGDLKDLNLLIKADVGGTAEVLSDTLTQLSTDKIRVRVLRAGVGAISESDVLLASTSDAIIIGFNVKADRDAQAVAERQGTEIRLHSIIYELIDEIRAAMTGLLDPVFKETLLGHAEVREIFKISKVGTIAGCYVADGSIRRDGQVRVLRGGGVIHTGKIDALKRFKNDASEVKNGLECGISLVNFNDIEIGDTFEAFAMERVAPEVPVTR